MQSSRLCVQRYKEKLKNKKIEELKFYIRRNILILIKKDWLHLSAQPILLLILDVSHRARSRSTMLKCDLALFSLNRGLHFSLFTSHFSLLTTIPSLTLFWPWTMMTSPLVSPVSMTTPLL